ncbi:unnamed protein product, partial [Prorocentrum cordatum]
EAMALAERLAAEKAESKSRKVRPEDLFGGEQAVQQKADIKLTDDKVKNHKMQGEFGAKKFIKDPLTHGGEEPAAAGSQRLQRRRAPRGAPRRVARRRGRPRGLRATEAHPPECRSHRCALARGRRPPGVSSVTGGWLALFPPPLRGRPHLLDRQPPPRPAPPPRQGRPPAPPARPPISPLRPPRRQVSRPSALGLPLGAPRLARLAKLTRRRRRRRRGRHRCRRRRGRRPRRCCGRCGRRRRARPRRRS